MRRIFRLSLAFVALSAACTVDDSLEPDGAATDLGTDDSAIAIPACPTPTSGDVVCVGSGIAYTTLYRTGATDFAKADLAQTFRAGQSGLPGHVFLTLREVRALPSGAHAIVRVDL